MKIILIIPCFNDNEHLEALLSNSTLSSLKIDVLIVDDGSSPSVSVDSPLLNIEIIKNVRNRGKGYSIKKAFRYALENGYTHAITLDADLQHDPDFIPCFLDFDHDIDVVIGRRNFGKDMPLHRRFSNTVTSCIISCLSGRRVLDSQSGYRRYRLENLFFEKTNEDGFQFESEILINQLRFKHSSLGHVSIPTIYSSEKSSINNILDTYKFIRLITRKLFVR